MIYLATFTISSILLHISNNKNRVLRYLNFFMAIIIPCLLAALRDYRIGIDTELYVEPMVNLACNLGYIDYIEIISLDGIELGFGTLVYCVSNYLGGLPMVFGILQLLIILPVYVRIRECKDCLPVFVVTFLFLLFFYNRSLNIVRQCIAMSIILYSLKYVENTRVFLFYLLLAFTFHKSAIIGIIYLILHRICKKNNITYILLYILALIIFLVFFDSYISSIINMMFDDSFKYNKYFLKNDTGFMSYRDLFFQAIPLAVSTCVLFIHKQLKIDFIYRKDDNEWTEMFLIALTSFMLLFLMFYNGDNYRFSLYFQIISPFLLAKARRIICINNRLLYDVFIVCIGIANWIVFTIIGDGYGTVPYQFTDKLF